MDDETLLNLLSMNPALRSRIESVLKVASNLDGSIELADSAEEKLIEIGRHLNREALQEWANNKACKLDLPSSMGVPNWFIMSYMPI